MTPVIGGEGHAAIAGTPDRPFAYFDPTQPPIFFGRLLAAQSIPNTTLTDIHLTSIVIDLFGFWNGTWPIIPAGLAGTYLVAVSYGWAANTTGFRNVDVGNDSTQDLDVLDASIGAAPAPAVTAQTATWISVGNPVGGGFYPQCSQTSGGPLNLNFCSLLLSRIYPR